MYEKRIMMAVILDQLRQRPKLSGGMPAPAQPTPLVPASDTIVTEIKSDPDLKPDPAPVLSPAQNALKITSAMNKPAGKPLPLDELVDENDTRNHVSHPIANPVEMTQQRDVTFAVGSISIDSVGETTTPLGEQDLDHLEYTDHDCAGNTRNNANVTELSCTPNLHDTERTEPPCAANGWKHCKHETKIISGPTMRDVKSYSRAVTDGTTCMSAKDRSLFVSDRHLQTCKYTCNHNSFLIYLISRL